MTWLNMVIKLQSFLTLTNKLACQCHDQF